MKKIFFLLLASFLSFGVAAQQFGDGNSSRKHKASKPKKQKKRKKKKKDSALQIIIPYRDDLISEERTA